MTCRDVREVADSFLCDELLTETNHDILQHLDACPSCRAEVEARRRLRGALRTAFERAPDLQPSVDFAERLRAQLREAPAHPHRSWMLSRQWFAVAAGVVAAAGLTTFVLLNRSLAPADALAQDAIGDHRNCALKVRLIRTPMPLEEAAERFDRAYRLLLDAPPSDTSTPDGPAHVVDRHACAYGGRRFGHVIMEPRPRRVAAHDPERRSGSGSRARRSAAASDRTPQRRSLSSLGGRVTARDTARQRFGNRRVDRAFEDGVSPVGATPGCEAQLGRSPHGGTAAGAPTTSTADI